MKADPSPAEKAQLAAGIQTLETIDVIRFFHVGTPANTNREVIDRSYDFSLLMTFDNASDEAQYQQDPTHLKFIEDCKHLWHKVLIYDSVSE